MRAAALGDLAEDIAETNGNQSCGNEIIEDEFRGLILHSSGLVEPPLRRLAGIGNGALCPGHSWSGSFRSLL